MNVLFVGRLPGAIISGAMSVNAQVLAGLAGRGARVRALAPRLGIPEGGVDPFAIANPAIEVERYPLEEIAMARDMLLVDRLRERDSALIRAALPASIEGERPDVLLLGNEGYAWHCADIAQAHRLPAVLVMHWGDMYTAMLEGTVPSDIADGLLEVYRRMDRRIAVAHHFAAGLATLGIEQVTVIPNPVDTARFAPRSKDEALLDQLGLRGSRAIVAFVADINAIKRPLDVVASAARCLRQQPDLSYLIVGDGALRSATEEACRAAGIMEQFRFVGWVDHARVPDHLALADLVLLPSEIEIQSLACLEAQACGRVVLASDIPASHELIVDGETGLLFPLGDVDALAATTLEALASPARLEAIGRRARQAALRHDTSVVIGDYWKTLQEVVRRAG